MNGLRLLLLFLLCFCASAFAETAGSKGGLWNLGATFDITNNTGVPLRYTPPLINSFTCSTLSAHLPQNPLWAGTRDTSGKWQWQTTNIDNCNGVNMQFTYTSADNNSCTFTVEPKVNQNCGQYLTSSCNNNNSEYTRFNISVTASPTESYYCHYTVVINQ